MWTIQYKLDKTSPWIDTDISTETSAESWEKFTELRSHGDIGEYHTAMAVKTT